MKVKCDDEDLIEIDDLMMDLLKHDLMGDIYSDIKRRLIWIIQHKCDQIYKRLEEERLPKLREDSSVDAIPKDKRGFCKLVFSHKDYKNREQREKESS